MPNNHAMQTEFEVSLFWFTCNYTWQTHCWVLVPCKLLTRNRNKSEEGLSSCQIHYMWSSGAVYTMDHEVVPRPSKRCDWTLKSSRDDLGLHQGKNGKVTTEVEVHKFVVLSLLYPLPWSNGFYVGTSKRGGLGKLARAHVIKMPF
jgi:hypothetical protein